MVRTILICSGIGSCPGYPQCLWTSAVMKACTDESVKPGTRFNYTCPSMDSRVSYVAIREV